MKAYDTAARNFYDSQEVKSLPLGSWDLFSSKFNILCKGLEEVNALKSMAASEKWGQLDFFEKEILENNFIVVVTDHNLNIVHASDHIYDMNGYRPNEILGKKPKMFQGAGTCQMTLRTIGDAVRKRESFEATILNYRKDGSTYKCWIKGEPIYNKFDEVVNFIAYEKEVA